MNNFAKLIKRSGVYWAFAAPLLLFIVFELVILKRGPADITDEWSFWGIQQGIMLAQSRPELLLHYPQFFSSLVFLILNALFDPVHNLSLNPIWIAWLILTGLFIIATSHLVGWVITKYNLPLWLVISLATLTATMSSMIRSYPSMSTNYFFGIIITVCALFAALAIESNFKDSFLSQWLFVLIGIASGFHYATIFIIVLVFSIYGIICIQERSLLLYSSKPKNKITDLILVVAVSMVSIAIVGQVIEQTYFLLGRLSYAFIAVTTVVLVIHFFANKRNPKKVILEICIAGTVQVFFYWVMAILRDQAGTPSIGLPHVVIATFPALLIVFSLTTKTWGGKIIAGPIGFFSLGILASANYGTPFILEGIKIARAHFQSEGFALFSELLNGAHCQNYWDNSAIVFILVTFITLLFRRDSNQYLRIFILFSFLTSGIFLLTTVPGSCIRPDTGYWLGYQSRNLSILLFFVPLAFIFILKLGKLGKIIGFAGAIAVCVGGILDYTNADWYGHISKIKLARASAYKIINTKLLDPDTSLFCDSRTLGKCAVACINPYHHLKNINGEDTLLDSPTRKLEPGQISLKRIDCFRGLDITTKKGKNVLWISDKDRGQLQSENWSLDWAQPPYLYLYSNEPNMRKQN